MITKVLMPQAGQDLETGRIVRWIKKVGERVKKGDVLCEVETEKAVVEVPSPADGLLLKILHPDDSEVKILSEIGLIGEESDALNDSDKAEINNVRQNDSVGQKKERVAVTSSTKIDRIRISPKARKIAEENNLPIAKITGSGPMGRIIEKDVMDFLRNQPKPGASPQSQSATQKSGVVPLNKIRKVTAQRLQQSKQTIPHFYISISVDMTPALKKQKELNAKYGLPKGETISVNDFIIRACALSLKEFPQLNSTYAEDGLHLSEDIDIGVAVALEDGLVVPVIENCDRLQMKDLSARVRQVVQAARSGRQLMTRPGRFTISNLGMFQVDEFSAIINPPEVGILAVGSIRKQLQVNEEGSISIRDIMKITLSVDHRVADGVMAAKFLNRIKQYLEGEQDY
jgi:pyruvate dehydrogenase E2 component (dihydrolipoamide acetyltransferase)